MASPTTLSKLRQNILSQIQGSKPLILDDSIVTSEDASKISTDFGLTSGNLQITGLTKSEILPENPTTDITISAGATTFLGTPSSSVDLKFTIVEDKVQLVMQIEFSDWKLEKAFSSNTLVYPFDQMTLTKTTFIYSSVAQSIIPKFEGYTQALELSAGLNLVSEISLTSTTVLSKILGTKLPGFPITLYGSFSAKESTAYPICSLNALLTSDTVDVLGLISLSHFSLFAEITDPGNGYIQDFNFGVNVNSSDFDYKIYISEQESNVSFSIEPNAGTKTSIEDIFTSKIAQAILPSTSGLDKSGLVPQELQTVFDDIDFQGASFIYNFSSSKVTFVSFQIGQDTSKSAPALGPFSFTNLVLKAKWIYDGASLAPNFVFTGDAEIKFSDSLKLNPNFLIRVENSGSGMELALIDVEVPGSISIANLIHDIDTTVVLPSELSDFYLGNFYFKYDKSNPSPTFTGSLVGEYTSTVLGNPFSANIVLSLTHSGDKWTPELKGGFAVGNESAINIDIKLQPSGGHSDLVFTGNSSNIPLSDLIDAIASDLGISDYSFIDFDIEDFKMAYNADSSGAVSPGKASMSSPQINIGSVQGTFNLQAQKNDAGTWEFYIKATAGAGHPIDLGSLIPVVGSELSGEVEFNDIGLYITSKSIDSIDDPDKPKDAGLSLSISGQLGDQTVNPVIPLYVYKPSGESEGDGGDTEMFAVADAGNGTTTTPSQNIKWLNFSKTIGPVTLKKIGFLPNGDNVAIYPDIILSKGGVELDLDGLAIDISVKELLQKKLDVGFSIDGLGVSYQSDTLELSGEFLKNTVTSPPPNSKNLTGYLGEVVAHFSRFGLSAIGGYIPAQEGYPESLFIYANLDGTLGGPPALYVTGIAFGFGLNYKLIPPTLKDLSTYALLPQNNPPKAGSSKDIGPSLTSLEGTVIQEQPGENWIAAGIQVTSYNMITGFALVSVSFGLETYIGILGSVSMTLPKGDPEPLGFVEIDATINFNPASGLLPILGVVSPSSYFLDGVITLTGGFAFYIWYGGANKGDFVFTIGGYYPSFTIPDNYPKVAPIDINFSMGPFKANGSAYLALTPGAFMAGFRYTASWSFANISAWYSLGLDFLVEWAPFSYQGDAYINIGVSVDLALFTVHASIGADAVVWGPPFGGKAHVDLDVVSFTIHFGSDQATPPPIDWKEFEKKFLPSGLSQQGNDKQGNDSGTQDFMAMVAAPAAAPTQSGKNVAATAAKGLLKTGIKVGGVAYDWLMDPNHFEIDTVTKMPANEAYWTSAKGTEYTIPNVATGTAASATNPEVAPFPGGTAWCPTVNLKPMKLSDVKSKHTITLIKADNDGSFTSSSAQYINDISITPLFNNSSAALWGKVETSDKKRPNDQQLENTLEGFTITPMPRNPSKVSQLPLIDLIFAEGNDEYFNYTQKKPDTTYKVKVTTDTDTELEIDITGGNPPSSPLTNDNLVLNSLTRKWVEEKRNPILDELNAHFNTLKSSDVTLTDMATTEQLNDWPQVEILGA